MNGSDVVLLPLPKGALTVLMAKPVVDAQERPTSSRRGHRTEELERRVRPR
jgi:hypothetical protein